MNLNSSEVRLHALDYLQVVRNRFPIILLVFCLVFVSAIAITHLMPKKYLGESAVEIVQNSDMFCQIVGYEVFYQCGA